MDGVDKIALGIYTRVVANKIASGQASTDDLKAIAVESYNFAEIFIAERDRRQRAAYRV